MAANANAADEPSWQSLVLFLACAVDASGRKSVAAEKALQVILLAIDSASVEAGKYVAVTRAQLEAKAGKDPKAMVAALKQMIKQDRVKGLSKKRKLAAELMAQQAQQQQHNAAPAPPTPQHKPQDDDDDEPTLPDEAEDAPEEHDREAARRDEIEQELSAGESLSGTPSQADIETAKEVLAIDPEKGACDKIYILTDFPATVEEAALLVPTTVRESCLDATVQLWGDAKGESYAALDRTQSRSSTYSAKTAGVLGLGSSALGGSEDDHKASAASLPPLGESKAIGASTLTSMSTQVLRKSCERLLSSRECMQDAAAVLHVEGASRPPNDLVAELKEARAHARGPGWKDVAFLELQVAPTTESDNAAQFLPLAVLRRFCQLAESVGVEKTRFSRFLSGCKHVQVPRGAPSDPAQTLKRAYEDACAAVPNASLLSSMAVLVGCMAQAVESEHRAAHSAPDGGSDPSGEGGNTDEAASLLIELGDIAGERVARVRATDVPPPACALRELIRAERSSWLRVPVPGGTGRQGMPWRPRLTDVERGVTDTEFLAFHGLTPHRLAHVRALMSLERLLERVDQCPGHIWDFSDRCVLREHSAAAMAQVLGLAVAEEPNVYTTYEPQLDRLLVVLHRPTPPGRQCMATRSAFAHTNLRPTLSEWPQLDLLAPQCIFDVDSEAIAAIEQTVHMLFPCDQSIVRLEGAPKTDAAWCTVEKDGNRFGLRQAGPKAANFFAAFEDETFLTLGRGPALPGKPDKLDTMMSCYTGADGSQVLHCSDGTIRMRRAAPRAEAPRAAAHDQGLAQVEEVPPPCEIERCVLGHGTVVIWYDDGSRRLLYANGDATTVPAGKDDPVTTCSFLDGGTRTTIDRATWESPKPSTGTTKAGATEPTAAAAGTTTTRVETQVSVDPATGALLLLRPSDHTSLLLHPDGSSLAKHGATRILRRGGEVRVEAADFASVKIFADVEATAYQHQSGGRVDISRGGRNVRSSTLLPDATVVHIEYDTRVTAKTCGSLCLRKPDQTTVTAADDGRVVVRPWNVDSKQRERRRALESSESELPRDARSQPDENVACYLFGVDDASFRVEDWERNLFSVSAATSLQHRKVTVELAGDFDPVKAVINYPITPRLFTMRGDGTGVELLTKAQLAEQRRRVAQRNRAEFASATGGADFVEACDADVSDRLEAVHLPLHTPLEQLRVASKFEVDAEARGQLWDAFHAASKEGAAAASAGVVPARDTGAPQLVDTVRLVQPLSAKDRNAVAAADKGLQNWREERAATEYRFNATDPRCEASKAEEARIMALIAKERRRQVKADRRRTRKATDATASHTSRAPSSRSLASMAASSATTRNPRSMPSPQGYGDVPLPEDPAEEDEDQGADRAGGDEPGVIRCYDPASNDSDEGHECGNGSARSGMAGGDGRPACPPPRNAPLGASANFWSSAAVAMAAPTTTCAASASAATTTAVAAGEGASEERHSEAAKQTD